MRIFATIKNAAKLGAVMKAADMAGARGVARATHFVERESKQRTRVRTGNLRRSETSVVKGMTGRVLTNERYAIYVHEGGRGISPGDRYMARAIEENIDEIKDMIGKEIRVTFS